MFRRYLPSAAIFLTTAACTRLVLQHTIDTRYQILAFWLFAALLEAAMFALRKDHDLRRLLINGCAATVAMVVVRLILEGVPEKVAHLL